MWEVPFEFTDPLERSGIPYAIVGSVAASVYGEPRATNDVDIVIHIEAREFRKIAEAFPAADYYVPPDEVLLAELSRSHGAHINVISQQSMLKADLYPLPAGERSWFERRREMVVGDRKVWLAGLRHGSAAHGARAGPIQVVSPYFKTQLTRRLLTWRCRIGLGTPRARERSSHG